MSTAELHEFDAGWSGPYDENWDAARRAATGHEGAPEPTWAGLSEETATPRTPPPSQVLRPADRPRAVSFADFVRHAEATDEQEWLVAGLVPKGGYTVLGGDPKSGKTLLAFDLGFAVASGRTFLGRATTPAAFLYVSEEGTRYEIAKRAERLLAHGEPARPTLVRWRDGIRFDDQRTWMLVRETLAELDQPTLLVLDPLRDLLAGDENDSSAIAAVTRSIAGILRDFTDVTVILIHHLSKTRREGAAGYRLRGSSALWGSVDCTLLMTADDIPEDTTGEVALRGKLRTEPRNDARAVMHWDWDPTTGLFSESSDPGTAAERAEDYLATNGPSLVAEIAKALGTTTNAVRTHLSRKHDLFVCRPGAPGQPSVWGLAAWSEDDWQGRNTPAHPGAAPVAPSPAPDEEDRNGPVAPSVWAEPETSVGGDRNTPVATPVAPIQEMPVEEDYPPSAYESDEEDE